MGNVGGNGQVLATQTPHGTTLNVHPSLLGVTKKWSYQDIAKLTMFFPNENWKDDYAQYVAYLRQLIDAQLDGTDSTTLPDNTISGFLSYCKFLDRNIYRWWAEYKKGDVVFVPRKLLMGFEQNANQTYDYESPVWALAGLYICVADVPPIPKPSDATIIYDEWLQTPEGLKPPLFRLLRNNRIWYAPTYPERRVHADTSRHFIAGAVGEDLNWLEKTLYPQLRFWDLISLYPTSKELYVCDDSRDRRFIFAGDTTDDADITDYLEPLNAWVTYWHHESIYAYCRDNGLPEPNLNNHPAIKDGLLY